ncbi:MAG TPA: hypothetical protein ENJ31_01505 [Anaerolineae bacterium]|nr:hypothetical protein [Anaerolineae bacterium]
MPDNNEEIRATEGWPPNAPREAYYHAWSPATAPARAFDRFTAQYGRHPAYIFMDKGLLWVGPVPDRGRDQ